MLVFKTFRLYFILSIIYREGLFLEITDLPGLDYMNMSVDPCDNFYEYTCGNFQNVNPRPEGYPLWDNYVILQNELNFLMQTILESKNRRDDPDALKKTRAVYKACMDYDYRDKLNIPEVEILRKVGGWPLISYPTPSGEFSWNDIGLLVAEYGIPFYFNIDVDTNVYNTLENFIYINNGNPLNPSIHDNIQENSANFLNYYTFKKSISHPYKTFLFTIATVLRDAIGSTKSNATISNEINDIVNFMETLKNGGIQDKNFNGSNENFTIKSLQQWMDREIGETIRLNWLEYFNRVFSKSGVTVSSDTTVIVANVSDLYGTLNLIKQSSHDMLKNFVLTRLFTYTSQDSKGKMRDAYQQFRTNMGDRTLSRSEHCLNKVLDLSNSVGLSIALTYEYQRYHFNPEKIPTVQNLIANLNDIFQKNIQYKSDWLDSESKKNALLKINKMLTLLAYPDFVENVDQLNKFYSNIRICAWNHFENVQRLRAFKLAFGYSLLGPTDRNVWNMSPLQVNALYSLLKNRILIPVSMLSSIFYLGNLGALDYGRLGVVISHEVTHGFDNRGMLFDGDGNMNIWWSESTRIEFNKRTNCFVDQYKKYYVPEIDKFVNSENTLGENIADNGGLRQAFKAFQNDTKRTKIDTINGFTPEQLFFIGFGSTWCTQASDDYLLHGINQSTYPPARFRVIGSVSNNEDFAKAFNCPVGSNMNPEKKCILW